MERKFSLKLYAKMRRCKEKGHRFKLINIYFRSSLLNPTYASILFLFRCDCGEMLSKGYAELTKTEKKSLEDITIIKIGMSSTTFACRIGVSPFELVSEIARLKRYIYYRSMGKWPRYRTYDWFKKWEEKESKNQK